MNHDTVLIGTPEAARRLGRHRSTFSRLVSSGRIKPVMRLGSNGPMLFDPADVDRVVAELSEPTTTVSDMETH